MTGSPAAWHRVAGERCERCKTTLAFLEGPLCDPCLEAMAAETPEDRYALWRDEVRDDAPPSARAPRPMSDAFAINLATGELVHA